MHFASKSGNADTVNLLISHGGDIHAVDKVNKYMCLIVHTNIPKSEYLLINLVYSNNYNWLKWKLADNGHF